MQERQYPFDEAVEQHIMGRNEPWWTTILWNLRKSDSEIDQMVVKTQGLLKNEPLTMWSFANHWTEITH